MSNVATNASNPIAQLRQQFVAMQPELAAALPAHVPPEKFVRVIMTAVQLNPKLAAPEARQSLLACAMKCAQDGLLPDGRDAVIINGNSKNKATGQWEVRAQYRPMIGGILKKIRQSGEVKSISVDSVRDGDRFRHYKDEMGEHFEHESLADDEASIIWVYAAVWTRDGGFYFRKMSRERVEKARQSSGDKDGTIWTKWWEDMAWKTVLRSLSKILPMSSEIETVIRRDDEYIEHGEVATQIPQAATQPRTAQARVKTMLGIAAPVPAITAEPTPPEPEPIIEDWNPETGEVIAAAAPEAPPAPPADQDADLYLALRECATMAELNRIMPDIAKLANGRRKAAIAVFEECKTKLAPPPKPAK